MKSVVQFAENVLKNGRDKYRENPTPLFADGINVFTGEQLKWFLPESEAVVVSDMACQQNLFRVLTVLTALTGDNRYKDSAKAAIKYHYDNLLDSSGLIIWGGHRFIDLQTLKAVGPASKSQVHELKNAFPYYDLMFEVDAEKTEKYIKAFWNAHVYDWAELHTGRHGQFGLEVGDIWAHELVNKPVFRESTGLSFINTGNDLIYAAGLLYKKTGDKGAFKWAKHLASQYIAARHPETGLGAYQFTQPSARMHTDDDNETRSWFGDRAKRQLGAEFGEIALEGNVLFSGHSWYARSIYGENALIQFELADEIGSDASFFLDWTKSGLLSFAKYAYIPETNEVKPMFTDGKDLTGYELKRNGYYGKAGRVLERAQADCKFLLSFARGFLHTKDEVLWSTARSIGRGNGLGDLGTEPGKNMDLNLNTQSSDARALFSVLDLYKATSVEAYLELAKVIGKNIEKAYFHHGYFTHGPNNIYAQFDMVEPLALLHLEAFIQNKSDVLPPFVDGKGFVHGEYVFPDGTSEVIKDNILYDMKK